MPGTGQMGGVKRMQIIIGSEIRIRDASKDLQDWCSENLIIPNPEYTNRTRRGLWIGNTPRYIWPVSYTHLTLPTIYSV